MRKRLFVILQSSILVFIMLAASSFAGTVYYDYDALDRLIQATPEDGRDSAFYFDEVGNREQTDASTQLAKMVDQGRKHTVILKTDGTVEAVGWNENGQLGNNSNVDEYIPVPVTGLTGIATVGAGGWYVRGKGAKKTDKRAKPSLQGSGNNWRHDSLC